MPLTVNVSLFTCIWHNALLQCSTVVLFWPICKNVQCLIFDRVLFNIIWAYEMKHLQPPPKKKNICIYNTDKNCVHMLKYYDISYSLESDFSFSVFQMKSQSKSGSLYIFMFKYTTNHGFLFIFLHSRQTVITSVILLH